MSELTPMTPGPSPAVRGRGRWLTFSLRTFLLVIAAIAICCGVIVNRARRQRDAVDVIQRLGGTVTYSYMEMSPRTWSSAGKPRGPRWARRILGPHYFDWPNLIRFEKPPNDEWARAVNELRSVRYLWLFGEHVSDDAIGRLTHLPNLWELQLTKTSIGDDGLKHLRQFPKLRWLVIDNARFSDAGLAELGELHDLEELSLWRTPLTDAAVPHLCRLRQLRKLDMRGSGITAEGAEELQKALPNCRIRAN